MSRRTDIELIPEDRKELIHLTRKGKTSARKINRARILLMSDEGKPDGEIREALGISQTTIWRTRKRYLEGGLDWSLNEQPRPGAPPKLDGKQEAFLVALACSDAPEGRESWTMQLLADRLVQLGVVESISDETVRLVLKKMT